MTRKDYNAAAKLVSRDLDRGNARQAYATARTFAEFFGNDNPAFQRSRFFEACGLQESDAHESTS